MRLLVLALCTGVAGCLMGGTAAAQNVQVKKLPKSVMPSQASSSTETGQQGSNSSGQAGRFIRRCYRVWRNGRWVLICRTVYRPQSAPGSAANSGPIQSVPCCGLVE